MPENAPPADAIQVLTTTASQEQADRIARTLVERRLAACAQVSGPITSHYRWQGQLESSQEWTCTAKTRRSHLPLVRAVILELHAYELPEIVAVPIVDGSQEYLAWLAGELIDVEPDTNG